MSKIKKAYQEFNKIRKTGRFNMFTQRIDVLNYAAKNGYNNLVAYCMDDEYKYLEILKYREE